MRGCNHLNIHNLAMGIEYLSTFLSLDFSVHYFFNTLSMKLCRVLIKLLNLEQKLLETWKNPKF